MKINAIGIIFASTGDKALGGMTAGRCIGSVPFGGRYRMIDFALSAMVNAGIVKVGITARSNYRSLMDHLGSGKPWDLSRKTGGIYLFPPYSNGKGSSNETRLQEFCALLPFLENSKEDAVLCCDCDTVLNIDAADMIRRHRESGADITFGYIRCKTCDSAGGRMAFTMGENRRIEEILVDPPGEGDWAVSANITVFNRSRLIQLIRDAVSRNYTVMERDVYQRQLPHLNMQGYRLKGYVRVIDSLSAYLTAHAELLQTKVQNSLFCRERPILTKVRDDAPARYEAGGSVHNSLVADGCRIAGQVENCILFRGVQVGHNACVQNCIVLQDAVIGNDAQLSYVIADKNAGILPGRVLAGFASYPVYIAKNALV